jgi:hypothetical protein
MLSGISEGISSDTIKFSGTCEVPLPKDVRKVSLPFIKKIYSSSVHIRP